MRAGVRARLLSAGLVAGVLGMTYVQAAPGVSARTTGASSRPFVTIGIIAAGAPINFFNTQPLSWGALDNMPLGILQVGSSNPNAFYPALAKSWSASKNGRVVTIHLQPKARWSDGKPITANDLKVTAAIGFARGTSQGFFLGKIKVVNRTTAVYTMLPGAKFNLFLRLVLEQTVAPASVFAKVLPSNIWSTIKTSQYTGTDAALVAKQKDAASTLIALGKKIEAYAPPKDIASGPYVLTAYNPGEAVLDKNKYFYAASKVRISRVILRNYNNDNNTIWNYILSGQVYQATSGGMSTALVKRMKAVPHNVFYKVPTTASAQLIFNESTYPYNLVKVRQALAYVINRNQVQHVGEPVGGSVNHWPSLTVDANTKAYLTKAQLKKLNPYKTNLAKATALLTSAGFKKSNGNWTMPDGKPFNVTLWAVNGFNDWVEASSNITTQLSSFGIQAQTQLSSSYAQYLKDLGNGKIPFGFWIGVGLTPYGIASRLFGAPDGYNIEGGNLVYYPPSASGKGNWVDFPQSVAVKGFGTVKVGPMTNRLNLTGSKAVTKSIMQKLIFAANQYVPEITLWDYVQDGFVNDQYFTDYPIKNLKVMRTCEGYYPPVGCWQLLGYVKSR